jgi:hypothetical protein
MKFISATLLVFSILFIQSCKQQEKPIPYPTVFEDYFIRYLSPSQDLKAQAIFASGDSIEKAQALTFSGGVAFEGSGMIMRKINENLIRYSIDNKMGYNDKFKFKYKNEAGEAVYYEISLNPIDDFFLKSTVSKSTGLDIVINGGLLSSEESIVFLFSDQNNVAASYTLNGPTTSIEFHLPADDLQNLTPGKGKLYLVKKQLKNEKLDLRDIHAEIEYYTKDVGIEIEE